MVGRKLTAQLTEQTAEKQQENEKNGHTEYEPLLGVTREQGHEGAGSKGQNSQGSREHENCNLGAGSPMFVSKKAAESKTNRHSYVLLHGIFSYYFYREHFPENQGQYEKLKRSRVQRREHRENEKGARMEKCKGAKGENAKEAGSKTPPSRASNM